MEEKNKVVTIINSHTHVFTIRHVPLILWLQIKIFAPILILIRLVFSPLQMLFFFTQRKPSIFDRAVKLQTIGSKDSQQQIFQILRSHYPGRSKFVLLAMDMKYMGGGPPRDSYEKQIKELAEIKAKWPKNAYPFVCVDPNRPNVFEVAKQAIEEYKFQGIKIYPPFGYFPFPFSDNTKNAPEGIEYHHKAQSNEGKLAEIFGYAEERGIPVLTHCTPGGSHGYKRRYTKHPITGHRIKRTRADQAFHLAHPKNYYYLLEQFPKLKICLAHFGGHIDWDNQMALGLQPSDSSSISRRGKAAIRAAMRKKKCVDPVWNPTTEKVEENPWVNIIRDLLKDTNYPNVYADVSFNAFTPETLAYLKLLVQDEEIRDYILFGTDFYVIRLHRSEKEFSVGIRAELGENHFRHISETNPTRFLNWGNHTII